jgi:hypothetical protein
MRYVLDRNFARSCKLKEVFRAGHSIIVPDDFVVEAFRSAKPFSCLLADFRILREFPNQVYYAHDRGPLYRRELIKGLPLNSDQVISQTSTEKFRCLLSVSTDEKTLSEVLDFDEFDSLAKDRLRYQKSFREQFIRDSTLKAEEDPKFIEELRNPLKRLELLQKSTFTLTEEALKLQKIEVAPFRERNSIIFAFNYTLLWRVFNWAIRKGIRTTSERKFRGDPFDLKYVLISCFFDGLLTNEECLKKCREECCGVFSENKFGM